MPYNPTSTETTPEGDYVICTEAPPATGQGENIVHRVWHPAKIKIRWIIEQSTTGSYVSGYFIT